MMVGRHWNDTWGILSLLMGVQVLLFSNFVLARSEKSTKPFTVQEIEVKGNLSLSDRTIKKAMLTKERGLFSKPAFYDDLFEDDLKSIVQLYRNHGFLDAVVSSEIEIIDEDKKRVALHIRIDEGQNTLIGRISFRGNMEFSDSELSKLISYRVAQPYNESLLEKNTYTLLAHYANKGYIDATVHPELEHNKEQYLINIVFKITEGVRAHIQDIEISGLEKIRPIVVDRELLIEQSTTFDYSRMLESQHRLYQTGLFSAVSISPVIPDSSFPVFRTVVVNLKEKKHGEVGFGVGFGSYERLRGSVEIMQNSLLGLSHQIGTRLRISIKNQKYEFLYTNPWLFGTRTKSDITAFWEHLIEPNYELEGGGGRSTIGRTFSQHNKVTLSYKYQELIFSNVKDTSEIRDRSRGNTRSLQVNYTHDTRNSQFNATGGKFFEVRWETAGGFLRGTNTFTKITGEGRYFFPIHKKAQLIGGMRCYTGWAQNFGESKNIPLNERFYAGGDGTIRGYGRREVGPKTSGRIPIGGKAMMLLNFEIRYPIYKKFGGTLFWDMGNVWSTYKEANAFKLRQGAGIGLRYHSPLGIVRVDIGVKIDRKKDENAGEIYFTLGQIF